MSQQIELISNPNGERNELYCQYVQIDALNAQQNDLIGSDGEHPRYVELLTTLSPPITDVHDVCVASLFYSNEHHRINDRNDTLTMRTRIGVDMYIGRITIEHGTYTAKQMEDTLNALIADVRWRSADQTAVFADMGINAAFRLTNHNTMEEVGRTVLEVQPFPKGAAIAIESVALGALLGFLGKESWTVSEDDAAPVKLVSPKMYNLTYDQHTFHLSSNALAQILEYPPSANSVMRENIVLSHHTTAEAMTPIIVDAMRTNDTRLRAKRNAQLSKIDLQLLDQQFKPIENSQMSAFSVILLVRRTKKLVV